MSDTTPKSEVARVLAAKVATSASQRTLAVLFLIASELNIEPEFESALKALEEEKADRG